jgi:flagellar biogenesis protein FliO
VDPFARLILATLLVGGAWFGVRYHARRRRGDARRQLEVLARLGLAKGVSVAVVRIAGRGLVLGVSDKGVSLVAELSGEALDEVVAAGGGHPDTSGPESEPESESDDRSTTHAEMGPGTGLVQRLQKMTLRTNIPATTGRPALRPVRGPVRAKKSA